jgi:intracellular septation protein
MKLLADFLPIILFFVAFKLAGSDKEAAAAFASQHFGFLVSGGSVGAAEAPVLLATLVVILATLAQVLVLKLRRRKVDAMLWVSLVLVVALGTLTIWFHNQTFIMWKPTLLYWVMAAAFLLGPLMADKNLLRLLLGSQLQLPEAVWRRLNWAWIAFFGSMGALNLWVAYTFSTDTWVNFKLFGSVGLILVFTLAQGLYLSRYMPDEPTPEDKP